MNKASSRVPLLALAGAALLAGMWAGLVRMGWQWPALQPTLPMSHGPLMVSGFFGTLILLERAVALGKRWAYAGVLFSGLGGLLVLLGMLNPLGPALMALGSLWMVFVFGYILMLEWRAVKASVPLTRRLHLHTVTMALGALCWLVGSLLWLGGRPVYQIVLWWAAFLVLTIAGERLELSRVTRPTQRTQALFGAAAAALLAGLAWSAFALEAGARLAGFGFAALAAWMLLYDIARRTVRKTGLTRYIAVCLLSGYFWLGVGGLLMLAYGAQPAGPRYDAMLHAIFLGFVISMVFGHAPIIFPAVLGLPLAYRPVFYVPLGLLHFSLLLRIAGDLVGISDVRLWGGLLNAIAILAFAGLMAWSAKKL